MDSAQQQQHQQHQQRQSRTDCDEEEDGRDVEMQPAESVNPKVAKKDAVRMAIEQQDAAVVAVPQKMEAAPDKSHMFWNRYVLHGLIDKGTFSTVSLATLRKEQHLPFAQRSQFAIKLLTPTSHPSRIEREILCMMKIGGQCNVVGLIDGFRFPDTGSVGLVMKYIPQEPFDQYYAQMTPAGVQCYMKELFIALERTHLYGVIHRDVKPSNFLHSPRNGGGPYVLVDFGLAQETNKGVLSLRTLDRPRQTEGRREDQVVPQRQDTVVMRNPLKRQSSSNTHQPLKLSNSMTKDLADVPLARQIKSAAGIIGNELRHRRSAVLENQSPNAKDLKSSSINTSVTARQSSNLPTCNCNGRPQVCNICLVKPEMNAPRAGTPGYRPPEVLLKHPDQSTAVDIWAAGVIFLSLLSKRYPFFGNVDDTKALAHIIEVFGFQRINETAISLNRTLQCTAETMQMQPYSLRRLCQHFRAIHHGREMGSERNGGNSVAPDAGGSSPPSGRDEDNFCCTNCRKSPDSCVCQRRPSVGEGDDGRTRDTDCDEYGPAAYDLLERLLEINPYERITASEALQHPYFQVEY
uniref:non-specific serine/threonine protein kinase n=1 Tax=Anopheles culicifacies TaxID=139723 RepID=A0A182LRE3_9DIPT